MAKAKRKRYTVAQKKKILNFVEDHNAKKGRGGQATASKKFKVSALSIGNWLKEGGASVKKSFARKTKASGSVTATLDRMTAIQQKIAALNAEFDALKKQL